MPQPEIRIVSRPDGRIVRVESVSDGSQLRVSEVTTRQAAQEIGTVTLTFVRPFVEFVEEAAS